jgi:hypothetical protein
MFFDAVALIDDCVNGDTVGLIDDCGWYRVCIDGKYTSRKCPLDRKGQRQAFDLYTNKCTDKVKFPVDGKCQKYMQCVFIESVSPFGKWTEMLCELGQHFDQESQKCIDEETSTCGKFQGKYFQFLNQILRVAKK